MPETFAAIAPQMESWNDITLVHKNERVVIDGVGFAAIGRLKLLQLLQQRVRVGRHRAGVLARVTSLDEFDDADLIVGADGVNSLVRRTFADEFGASRHAMAPTASPGSARTQGVRHADADLSPHADRRFQRASLPLRAGPQHLHRRGRRARPSRAPASSAWKSATAARCAKRSSPTRSAANR